jgi:hypothetical protein
LFAPIPLDFQWPFGLLYQAPATGRQRERCMLDVVMLAIGVGAFALFIGYVALCERL